jgi:hypothetical protein
LEYLQTVGALQIYNSETLAMSNKLLWNRYYYKLQLAPKEIAHRDEPRLRRCRELSGGSKRRRARGAEVDEGIASSAG